MITEKKINVENVKLFMVYKWLFTFLPLFIFCTFFAIVIKNIVRFGYSIVILITMKERKKV